MNRLYAYTTVLLFSLACGAGDDGASALIITTDEAPGANCSNGGIRIDTGLDDGDGILDAGEVDSTVYICTGDTGDTGDTGETETALSST